MLGVIKKVNEIAGYGFIRPEGGVVDIFFHATSWDDKDTNFQSVKEGMEVSFEIYNDDRRGQQKAVGVHCVQTTKTPWPQEVHNTLLEDGALMQWYDIGLLDEDDIYLKVVAHTSVDKTKWFATIGVSRNSDRIVMTQEERTVVVLDRGVVLPEKVASTFFPSIHLTYEDE